MRNVYVIIDMAVREAIPILPHDLTAIEKNGIKITVEKVPINAGVKVFCRA